MVSLSAPPHPGSLLPLWDVADSTLITTQGCYLRFLEVIGVDSEYTDAELLKDIADALYAGVKRDVAADTFLQFVVTGHSDYSDVWDKIEADEQPQDSVLRYQRASRLEFLKSRNLRRHACYLVVGTLDGMNRKEFTQYSLATHRERMARAARLEAAVRSVLQCSAGKGAARITLKPLNDVEILDVIYRACNPGKQRHRSPVISHGSSPMTLREQMLQSPISWGDHHVRVGTTHHRVLTLKSLPDSTRFAQMEVFLGLPFDLRLSVYMAVPQQQGHGMGMALRRNVAKSWSEKNTHSTSQADVVRLEEAEALDSTVARTKQTFVHCGIQVVIPGSSQGELQSRVDVFVAHVQKAGYVFHEETGAHDLEFFKTVPGMGIRFDRWREYLSNHAVDLMPVFGACHGDRDPVFLLKTAGGELFSHNPAEISRDHWNACVFGAPGAGKSVLINMLITTAMLAGPSRGPVMVVDYAGEKKSSYLNIVELFGGTFVPVLAGQGESINPFPPPQEALDSDKNVNSLTLNFLKVFLDLLLGNTGLERERELDRGILQSAILQMYARHQGDAAPLLDDYLRVLQDMRRNDRDTERVAQLTALLETFVSGSNARLFNRPTTLRTNSPFVVFDLHGIKEMPENLQGALAFLICHYLKNLAFRSKNDCVKYIVLDEVAQLMTRPEMRDIVGELYSTGRKHHTATITITQEYLTYCKSALGETIGLCSSTKWFFSHKDAPRARERIVEDFEFNEREAHLFASLETRKGAYSEVLVKTEVFDEVERTTRSIFSKLRLELSPFDYQLATSDRRDRMLQRQVAEAHPSWPLVDVLIESANRQGAHRAT